jgi:hypothetical protein
VVSAEGIHEVLGRDTQVLGNIDGRSAVTHGASRSGPPGYIQPPRERTTYHSERKYICVGGLVIMRRRQVCRVQYIMGSTLFQVTVVYGQVKEP